MYMILQGIGELQRDQISSLAVDHCSSHDMGDTLGQRRQKTCHCSLPSGALTIMRWPGIGSN